MVDPKKLVPLNGMILVLDDERKEKVGQIFLAESVEADKMVSGTVLAGSYFMLQDGTYVHPEVDVGDKVFYSIHAGVGNVWIDDKKTYRVMRHNEMLAKIKGA